MKKVLLAVVALMCSHGSMWSQTANISGRITCSGSGVKDVVVSDGYEVTTTDENGTYSFYSQKKNGYVFYSIPSGYMPYESATATAAQKIFSQYWHALTAPTNVSKAEVHNFELQVVNNDKFQMLVGADPQVANRFNGFDAQCFQTLFFPRSKQEVDDAGSTPIYSTYLGDLAWDNYWYSNSWTHVQYKSMFINNYSRYKMKQFPVMGNHDHDGATPSNSYTDFNAAQEYRTQMGPNYYSYNIGKVHWISMDDIIYKNTYTSDKNYSTGIVGDRDYDTGFSQEQVDWLKKDLAHVDKNTTVILTVHAPLWYVDSSNRTVSYKRVRYADVEALLKPYKQVHVLSGHRHLTYNMFPTNYPNIMEHSLGAMGGDLYDAAYYGQHPVCQDGTPGGYQMFYFNGDEVKWQFHNLENDLNSQFRVTDGNTVKELYKTDGTLKALVKAGEHQDYSTLEDNVVLLNVFNWDPQWKVEAYEGSKKLNTTLYRCQDMFHILCFDYVYYRSKGTVPSSYTLPNTHSFKIQASHPNSTVTIKVTDRFGNIYLKNVERPFACNTKTLQCGGETYIPEGTTGDVVFTMAINGIDYQVNYTQNTASVVKRAGGYKGSLVIPTVLPLADKELTVTAIADEAFEQSTELQSVDIPVTVKQIGNDVFKGCTNLSSIYCNSPEPSQAQASAFASLDHGKCVIIVPAHSEEAYKAATGWSSCADILQGESLTKLLGVSFDASGILLTGKDANHHKAAAMSNDINSTYIMKSSLRNDYLGCTNNNGSGFYYVTFDKDDALGTAMQKNLSVELLFRLDNKNSYTYNNGASSSNYTCKFLSCTQAGGWGIKYYPGPWDADRTGFAGVSTEYSVEVNGENTYYSVISGVDKGNVETGKFYHVIAVYDKDNGKIALYMNGKKLGETQDRNICNATGFPNIGTTAKEKGMWIALGADPGGNKPTAPSSLYAENSNRSTFVFANFYDKALSEKDIAQRYADEQVQYYVNSEMATTSDLLWDVVPMKGNKVYDASVYNKINVKGTIPTQYNAEQNRYETVWTGDLNKLVSRYYGDDPTITKQMAKAISIEMYAKSNTEKPEVTMSPLSFQQDGTLGFEFSTTGAIRLNANFAGYRLTGGGAVNLSVATDDATLNTDYTHYVLVVDKENNHSYIYINGKLVKDYSVTSSLAYDYKLQSMKFSHAPYLWFCYGGDTRANLQELCDYPFNGNISIGRVWGKALTAADAQVLYKQATTSGMSVTIGENGFTTACMPYAAIMPAGVSAYVVDSETSNAAHLKLYAAPGQVIPYGVPVVLTAEKGTYTLPMADTRQVVVLDKPAQNLLIGSFASKAARAQELYSLHGSELVLTDGAVLPANQAWLPFSMASASKQKSLILPFTRGDINNDRVLNVGDVTALINLVMSDYSHIDNIFMAADMNADGVINVGDITQLIEMVMSDK